MKKIVYVLIAVWLSAPVQAQVSPQVTFTVNGNKDLQLSIDGINHDLRQAVMNGTVTMIPVNNLNTGQHKYILARTLSANNKTERIAAVFYLRKGYDLSIQLNEDGSLALIESKNTGAYVQMLPMQSGDFNTLLNRVKNQKSLTGKKKVINQAFNAAGNFFSSSQVYQLLQQITAESGRLQLAKLSYDLVTDKGNFYKLFDVLQSQSARNELETYVQNYNREAHSAMADADFNTRYQTIQQQWPASTQINSISNAFNNTGYYFTTAQARKLILLITGEASRLQLAKLAYRSITDRNNFYQLNDVFSSQSSINELTAYVNQYNSDGAGSNNRTAMSDAGFNTLYQTVQLQFFPGERMSAVTNAFNNANNFFSSTQAKQLIQLITFESNRLQLAELSYRKITDPENFILLYELFDSQSNKDELDAYVKNVKQ